MAKRRFISLNLAAEIIGCTPAHVMVLSRRYPVEFAPVIIRHNRIYFLPSLIEKFKKSGRLIPQRHPVPKPDEIWA